MSTNAKIKVIKKSEMTTKPAVKVEQKNPKASAREMVSTVSNWVTDFQQRRRDETRQAIDKFFSQQTQTSGV